MQNKVARYIVVHIPKNDTSPVQGVRVSCKGRIHTSHRHITLLTRKDAGEAARQLNADSDKRWEVIRLIANTKHSNTI